MPSLSLVFPPQCALCETEVGMGQRLCTDCRQQLSSEAYCCQRCAMPLPSVVPNQDCIHCRKSRWKFSRVIALGQYRGRLKEAVLYSKKMKGDSLRYALSELLAERAERRLARRAPVPLYCRYQSLSRALSVWPLRPFIWLGFCQSILGGLLNPI